MGMRLDLGVGKMVMKIAMMMTMVEVGGAWGGRDGG